MKEVADRDGEDRLAKLLLGLCFKMFRLRARNWLNGSQSFDEILRAGTVCHCIFSHVRD